MVSLVAAADESIKARAAGTGGALGLVETSIPPGHSPALHVHRHEHEAFYVLAGIVDFFCGDEQFRARAGSFVFLPRAVPHTFLGISEESARVLVLSCQVAWKQCQQLVALFRVSPARTSAAT